MRTGPTWLRPRADEGLGFGFLGFKKGVGYPDRSNSKHQGTIQQSDCRLGPKRPLFGYLLALLRSLFVRVIMLLALLATSRFLAVM